MVSVLTLAGASCSPFALEPSADPFISWSPPPGAGRSLREDRLLHLSSQKVPQSKRTPPALLEGMLRRNCADTFLEIRLSATSRTKFPRARPCNSASGARRADLICWTHFCSSHISTAPAKLSCAGSPSSLLHEKFSVDHFRSFLLPGSQRDSLRCFFPCGPSFPHSFSQRREDRFVAMDPPPARSDVLLRWTHFPHSVLLMKSRRCTLSIFTSPSMGYEKLEFRKHRKRAESSSDWFGQHRDPGGADCRGIGTRPTGGGFVADQNPSGAGRLRPRRPGHRKCQG